MSDCQRALPISEGAVAALWEKDKCKRLGFGVSYNIHIHNAGIWKTVNLISTYFG